MTKKHDEIFQVHDGIPYLVGWRSISICCGCNLVHHDTYSVRTNRKTGKRELWCRATRDLKMTKNLRRRKR